MFYQFEHGIGQRRSIARWYHIAVDAVGDGISAAGHIGSNDWPAHRHGFLCAAGQSFPVGRKDKYARLRDPFPYVGHLARPFDDVFRHPCMHGGLVDRAGI